MLTPELLAVFMIFAIPILGIGLAGYKEWLKFRAKQREQNASTKEIEEQLSTLQHRLKQVEQERDNLRRRLQNLETIVTSERWDALHDATAPDASPLPEDSSELDPPSSDAAHSGAERTEQIARRLRS